MSAAADGWEDGDLVTVAEKGGVAVERFVAVDPDPCSGEDGGELRPVAGAQVVEQLPERGGGTLVVRAAGSLPGLGEQPDPYAQGADPSVSTFVRAVGIASSRAGSMGSPVTSSMP